MFYTYILYSVRFENGSSPKVVDLREKGLYVLRFKNEDLSAITNVIKKIEEVLEHLP